MLSLGLGIEAEGRGAKGLLGGFRSTGLSGSTSGSELEDIPSRTYSAGNSYNEPSLTGSRSRKSLVTCMITTRALTAATNSP